MATEAPQVERGLKLPFKKSDLIAKGIDVLTPERTLDVFSSFFQYEEEDGYTEGVLHYLGQGYWPVGVFNHFVHSDGIAYAIASKHLIGISNRLDDPSKHLQGCYGLHQGTMESGDQGEDLQTYTLKLEAAAQKMGLIYLPWITPKHVKQYNLNEEEVNRQNDASGEKMKSAPSERVALLTFPAGNMEAARRNEDGQRRGMVGSDLTWITQMALFLREGVKIVFLPGVITDSFRISDPDTRDLTREAAWSFLRNLLTRSRTLPLVGSLEAKLATVTMLRPYPVDRLAFDLATVRGSSIDALNLGSLAHTMRANKELTDQLIMGIINDKLPDRLKGNHYKGYQSFGLGDYTSSMY